MTNEEAIRIIDRIKCGTLCTSEETQALLLAEIALDGKRNPMVATSYTNHESTCNTENDVEKPPVGVEPYWSEIPERIDNLAEAIKRYSGRKDGKVETWAAEIVALRKVQELLDKEYGR